MLWRLFSFLFFATLAAWVLIQAAWDRFWRNVR